MDTLIIKHFYFILPESISVSCSWGKKNVLLEKNKIKHDFMKYFALCTFLEHKLRSPSELKCYLREIILTGYHLLKCFSEE